LAHPLAFAAFLKHVGAPAERLLRRQGLAVYCDDPEKFVPLRQAWSFLDAAAQSEDLMVGWHVGRFVGDHNLKSKFLPRPLAPCSRPTYPAATHPRGWRHR
jgi:hypothetical protein